jgi:hypothetical protein
LFVSETIVVSEDLDRWEEEEQLDKSVSPSFYV